MKQRLEDFLNAEGLTKAQFADSINVARAAISHIAAGRNMPSYDFIVNTMKAFPDLNIEWLLTGKGSMYKDGRIPEPQEDDLFSTRVYAPAPDSAPVQDPSAVWNTPVEPVAEPQVDEVTTPVPEIAKEKTTTASIKRIVVYYSDGTYKDFKQED